MADIQIRSFEEDEKKMVDGREVTAPKKVFELLLTDTIDGQRLEHTKRYDVEPTNEQRAAFEGEAREQFQKQIGRSARRNGVAVDDPGVTPAAQPVTGPAAKAHKKDKGTTAKK